MHDLLRPSDRALCRRNSPRQHSDGAALAHRTGPSRDSPLAGLFPAALRLSRIFLQPYLPQDLASPNLGNSPRIDSLMRDGKIYLSIDDAVALALENNLDLEIARYNLNIADADLLRAKSGASILGINTGIVQNTPGGGVGGLGGTVGSGTGGTTVAAGGAGTGTNGLVSSTLGIGSPITSFDPALTGTMQLDKNETESVSVFSPVPGHRGAEHLHGRISVTRRDFSRGRRSPAASTIPTSPPTTPPACSRLS